MIRLVLAFGCGLWLAGCVAPGPFGGHPPVIDPPPVEIVSAALECKVDQDRWELAVTTTAWGGGGTTAWTEDGEYVEDHPVKVVWSAEDGRREELVLDVAIVADWRLVGPDATVFTCGDAPTVVLTVFDLERQPADCATFDEPGDDPSFGCR